MTKWIKMIKHGGSQGSQVFCSPAMNATWAATTSVQKVEPSWTPMTCNETVHLTYLIEHVGNMKIKAKTEKTELHVLSPDPSLELVSGCSIATGSPCFRPQDQGRISISSWLCESALLIFFVFSGGYSTISQRCTADHLTSADTIIPDWPQMTQTHSTPSRKPVISTNQC